jgi:hypothetical protein
MSMSLNIDLPESQPPGEGTSSFRWGTVVDTSPLTIRLDGDSVALNSVPDTLRKPSTLVVGARVWVQLIARRVIVLGSTYHP